MHRAAEEQQPDVRHEVHQQATESGEGGDCQRDPRGADSLLTGPSVYHQPSLLFPRSVQPTFHL